MSGYPRAGSPGGGRFTAVGKRFGATDHRFDELAGTLGEVMREMHEGMRDERA